MNERSLIEEEIARALQPLLPAGAEFKKNVHARIAAGGAPSLTASAPIKGRSWLSRAGALLPVGLMESSALAKGVGAGAGTAAKGGATLGMFSVVGAILGVVASLAALLTLGRFQIRRVRNRPSRPARLSDRMNYAEDNRWIGGIIAVVSLGVYLLFFESFAVTLLIGAAVMCGATVFTLLTLDHAGRATKDTLVDGFDPYFAQAGVCIWIGLMIQDARVLSGVLMAAPAVLLLGSAGIGFIRRPIALVDALINAALPLLIIWTAGEEWLNPSVPGGTAEAFEWSSSGWLGFAEWTLLTASVASVLLVLVTAKEAPEDIFAGPRS